MADTLQQRAILRAWNAGHFFTEKARKIDQVQAKDLSKLTGKEPVVKEALRSLMKAESFVYGWACEQIYKRPAKSGDFDGEIGPAMSSLLQVERCSVPDIAPPKGVEFAFEDGLLQQVAEKMQQDNPLQAVGPGNWPECHGIGDFHCASVRIQTKGCPDFLKPHLKQVLTNVQRAYAEIGLLFIFTDENKVDLLTGKPWASGINIEFSWVTSSSGWIGLAIVGTGEGCSSNIWCRYLATYRGGSTPEAIIAQWTSLVKHELGHNCGLGHSNGGVMNPSIVNNLPLLWVVSDPSTPKLKSKYGGVRVPFDGPAPGPEPGPDDKPDSLLGLTRRVRELEEEVARQRNTDIIQDGINEYILMQLRKR